MGGVRDVSSDLHRKNGRSGVRAARLSKKDAADKPAGHHFGTQPVHRAESKSNVISQGPPYEEFDSVWDALGFSPQEAANLETRSELMVQIREIVRASGWTQAKAAKHCGVSQPRINDLLRGKIDKFSIDALVNMAAALGRKVKLEVRAA